MTIPGQDNLPVNDLPPTSSDASEQTYVDMVPVGILTTASLHSSDSEIDDPFAERPTRSMPWTMIAQCDPEQQNSGR